MVIAPGTRAPEFTLSDQYGTELPLSELVAESPVALVFFPFAFSGICQGELCELRENISLFDDAQVRLVGISIDSVFTLKAWAEQQEFEFSLLSDFWPHGAVAQKFGVFLDDVGIATRATVLIGGDGVVAASFETAPGAARDLGAYREALQQLR